MVCITTEKSDQKQCVKIDVPPPDTVIIQDGGTTPITINMIKTAISAPAKVIKQQRRPFNRKATKIFLVFLCFVSLSGTLFIMQQHFLKNIEAKLHLIQKITFRQELQANTESTPSIDMERGLSSEEIDPQITGITVVIPERTGTGNDNSNDLDDSDSQTTLGPNKAIDENIITDPEEKSSLEEDFIVLDGKLNHEKAVEYVKMGVIFKIYAYIYAFYISITFLMLLQFILIIRLLDA